MINCVKNIEINVFFGTMVTHIADVIQAEERNKRIIFFHPFILRSVSFSSPLISLFAKSFEDSETSFPVMRYIRRRNLEHHSEAINLLAALQAPMHSFSSSFLFLLLLLFEIAYFFAIIAPC